MKERRIVSPMATSDAEAVWQAVLALVYEGEAKNRLHQAATTVELPPRVAWALLFIAKRDPCPMRELVQYFSCDASYVTALVDALEGQDLAVRLADALDRRAKSVALTVRGLEVA